jgi:UDP-N-acetylglucosamine 4,6-dehydratase
MKKLLITGGSGTIGRKFIETYYDDYEIYNYSRDESLQSELLRTFPKVKNIVGSIEDKSMLFTTFDKIKPDIVVHSAAMKHLDMAENNPIQACKVNVVGSLNIIEASIHSDVRVTIAISTDKSCDPENTYGYSKSLMERCFLDANTDRNRFACTRFANVTHSSGSVIPFWLKLKSEGKSLKLTDRDMNRLMFSQLDSVKLVKKAIDECEKKGGFVLSTIMKKTNMYELAKFISDDIEMVGKRDGEKLDEKLISEKELPFTYIDGNYVFIRKEINENISNRLEKELSSETGENMNQKDLKELVYE